MAPFCGDVGIYPLEVVLYDGIEYSVPYQTYINFTVNPFAPTFKSALTNVTIEVNH